MLEENEPSILPTLCTSELLTTSRFSRKTRQGRVFEFALPISISISNQMGSHQRVVYCASNILGSKWLIWIDSFILKNKQTKWLFSRPVFGPSPGLPDRILIRAGPICILLKHTQNHHPSEPKFVWVLVPMFEHHWELFGHYQSNCSAVAHDHWADRWSWLLAWLPWQPK